jgi:NAD-dependent DNA ligase
MYDSNYREGTPICSDEAYDRLVEELIEKFPDSELLKKGIVEQKVSRKQRLPLPMFSLNKCKTIEEIKQWLQSNNISEDELLVVTPKYDGISLVVNELDKQAWTRGDGEFGQESKAHFRELRGYNSNPYTVYSFGEAIMSNENFQKHKDQYANPRNMVAGLFNRDIISVGKLKDVDYIRYGTDFSAYSKAQQLEMLNKLNTVKVLQWFTTCERLNKNSLDELYKGWSKDYQIDGLVIDINSSTLRNELGREENMNPKYARAYKNPEWSGSAEVRVTGITWQVSKQGKLKPIINIEPTEVSGVTISNVTGYNAAYIFDNNIAEDSVIQIVRSGDVIPKHIKTVSFEGYECMLLQDAIVECPCCYQPTKWDETMTEVICTNPECQDKLIAKLVHFFSTLEVEDFGEPSIRTFYLNGFKTVEAILNMKQIDIVSIEGFGIKSSVKLISQFGKIKRGVSLAKILHALDVFDGLIGEKTCQKIFDEAENYYILDSIIKVEGIAEKTARVFSEGITRYIALDGMDLVKITHIQSPKEAVLGDKLKDEKICFTGCRPSKDMGKKIQQEGGQVVSGVSKNTTMLVVKDKSETTLSSNKAVTAKKLGIKIVEFKYFM